MTDRTNGVVADKPTKTALSGSTGTPGLVAYGGVPWEEWDRRLQGEKGLRAYRQMLESDPICAAMAFGIEAMIREPGHSLEDADESEQAKLITAHVETCFEDMYGSWGDTISEILSCLWLGFSVFEAVYKVRQGTVSGGESWVDDELASSRYDDGRIGWAYWGPRSQETVSEWVFDPKTQFTTGFYQDVWSGIPGAPSGRIGPISLSRCLHFRVQPRKQSPIGLALDPTTPVPTPDGWRTMDDLMPGDKVFDEQGRVRYVTNRAEWHDRPCYEVGFNDRSSIIADENHEWLTQTVWERSSRRPGGIRSTKAIAETLTVATGGGTSNHGIRWAEALDYPAQILPLDPYYLGLWLGDGGNHNSSITCHEDDLEETTALIAAAGYSTSVVHNGEEEGKGRLVRVGGSRRRAVDGPQHILRMLGLLENKHIPPAYLRGSKEQRLALLAGLMDSDGSVNADGGCEFTNTDRALINGVAELVRSLGCGVRVRLRRRAGGSALIAATGQTVTTRQDSWAAFFTPPWNPFRLSRKAQRTINDRGRRYHYIVSVTPVERRRTVCIEVDGPSHLFLAGRSMVPTHNSLFRGAYEPWYYAHHLTKVEAITAEKSGVGTLKMYAPADKLEAGSSDRAALEAMVSNFHVNEQQGFLLPSEVDPETNQRLWDAILMASPGQNVIDLDKAINRHDRDKLLTLLMQFALLGQGSQATGSYAQSVSGVDFFMLGIGVIQKTVADVITAQGIDRLVKANGWPVSLAPTFRFKPARRRDLAVFAEAFAKVAQYINTNRVEVRRVLYNELEVPVSEKALQQEMDDEAADAERVREQMQATPTTTTTTPPPATPSETTTVGPVRQASEFAEPEPIAVTLSDADIADAVKAWDRLMPEATGLLSDDGKD